MVFTLADANCKCTYSRWWFIAQLPKVTIHRAMSTESNHDGSDFLKSVAANDIDF